MDCPRDSNLSYHAVNSDPRRYFRRDVTLLSSAGGERHLLADFSGSMTDASKKQWEHVSLTEFLRKLVKDPMNNALDDGAIIRRVESAMGPRMKYATTAYWREWISFTVAQLRGSPHHEQMSCKLYPFGSGPTRFGRNSGTWRYWLDTVGDGWITPDIMWSKYASIPLQHWGAAETFFPYATYTTRIEKAIAALPDDVAIDLALMGDGAMSDRNFIDIMRRASAPGGAGVTDPLAGKMRRVNSFTFFAAHNTSASTKRVLDAELKQVLLASRSTIQWKSVQLSSSPGDLERHLRDIKSSSCVVPDGWLLFDTGMEAQLFHEKLTPMSIHDILLEKGNHRLIPEYIQYLVKVFESTPIVFSKGDHIASKIFQALKLMVNYKNDKFNIQLFLLDRFSRANTTATHKTAYKMLRESDDSSERLFMERMATEFSGAHLKLVKSSTDHSSPYTPDELDIAMRDMSFNAFIALMDRSFCESSSSVIVSSGDGFPLVADGPEWKKHATNSMRMFTYLLGDGRMISGNFQIMAAMYILINEYITHPYLNRMARAFVLSPESVGKIFAMIYKPHDGDGSADSPGLQFQDNIYSATFSRIVYEFGQLFGDEMEALGTTSGVSAALAPVKEMYEANCKIRLIRTMQFTKKVSAETYVFNVGSWFLVGKESWEEDVTEKFPLGKSCPYPEMPNIVVITAIPERRERNYKKGCLRVCYVEGDDKDYTYVPPRYLTKLCDAQYVDAEDRETVGWRIKKFLRSMWLKWKHHPSRGVDAGGSVDDGKMTHDDGSLVTYKENLVTVKGMLEPDVAPENHRVEPKTLHTVDLAFTQDQIWAMAGFSGSPVARVGKITKEMIEWVRCMPNDVDLGTLCSSGALVSDLSDELGIFKHTVTTDDVVELTGSIQRALTVKCGGYECACACGAIIRPGVTFTDPGCGHHFLPACLATYTSASQCQNAHNFRFDVSKCAQGCLSCLAKVIHLDDGTSIPLTRVDNAVVNASSTSIVGRCDTCYTVFVRGPRDCATSHSLPTQCSECLPKLSWRCDEGRGAVDGDPDDPGPECSLMVQHGGGCRMMQCCPVHDGWDDPCSSECDHRLYSDDGEHVIAIGCGCRYKMADGLAQRDGTNISDGSEFY